MHAGRMFAPVAHACAQGTCTHAAARTYCACVQASAAAGGHGYDHMRFYATRDIARGEALHFSYLTHLAVEVLGWP